MANPWQPSDFPLLVDLQERWTADWHDPSVLPDSTSAGTLADLVRNEHRANFDLWHEEDKARDPTAADSSIARIKRNIDAINQRRNDLVEQVDLWLLDHGPAAADHVPLHSETPGMMLDRLSILALKIFHTREQIDRSGVPQDHILRNQQRLDVLLEQRSDLATSLTALLHAMHRGERRFKLYRQLKMYNDPNLNPQVYGRQGG